MFMLQWTGTHKWHLIPYVRYEHDHVNKLWYIELRWIKLQASLCSVFMAKAMIDAINDRFHKEGESDNLSLD